MLKESNYNNEIAFKEFLYQLLHKDFFIFFNKILRHFSCFINLEKFSI